MMACTPRLEDPFRCPTKWQLWRQILALLPRGRAWQTHEEVADYFRPPRSAQVGTFEVGASGVGTDPELERLTVMQQYWAAFAEVLEHLHQRACALLEEFFCATTRELAHEWGIDYGFPDPCEPWQTLCDKVKAQGGATCAYLADIASQLGYAVTCHDCATPQGVANCLVTDCTPIDCECEPNVIRIRIHANDSPRLNTPTPFAADALVADCTPPCPPAPEDIVCLINRYKPAHVRAIIEVI